MIILSPELNDLYKFYCEANNLKIEDFKPDSDFYDWLADVERLDWEAFQDEIKPFDECIIVGKLGLWHGCHDIIPERCDTVLEAVEKCLKSCTYYDICLVDGHIEVKASHHDGTNYFEIYLLNKKGQNAGEMADLSKKCYHAKIKL